MAGKISGKSGETDSRGMLFRLLQFFWGLFKTGFYYAGISLFLLCFGAFGSILGVMFFIQSFDPNFLDDIHTQVYKKETPKSYFFALRKIANFSGGSMDRLKDVLSDLRQENENLKVVAADLNEIRKEYKVTIENVGQKLAVIQKKLNQVLSGTPKNSGELQSSLRKMDTNIKVLRDALARSDVGVSGLGDGKGLVATLDKRLATQHEQYSNRFSKLEEKLDTLNSKVVPLQRSYHGGFHGGYNTLLTGLGDVNKKLDSVDKQVSSLSLEMKNKEKNANLNVLELQMLSLGKKMEKLQQQIKVNAEKNAAKLATSDVSKSIPYSHDPVMPLVRDFEIYNRVQKKEVVPLPICPIKEDVVCSEWNDDMLSTYSEYSEMEGKQDLYDSDVSVQSEDMAEGSGDDEEDIPETIISSPIQR